MKLKKKDECKNPNAKSSTERPIIALQEVAE
jgi:hypothetical protein